MTVRAQPEELHTKKRPGGIQAFGFVIGFERALIGTGGVLRDAGRRNAVNVLRWYGRLRQHRRACHAVIALWVVPRNKAFVAPEPMHALPRQRIAKRWFREQLVEPAWSRAARKADRKPTAARHGQFGNPSSDPAGQSFGILAYLNRSSRHLHSLRSRTRRAADRGDGACIIGRVEHVGTGNDRVRSGLQYPPGMLAAEAWIDRHDQYYPAELEHILDHRQRRRRVEDHPRGLSQITNVSQGPM